MGDIAGTAKSDPRCHSVRDGHGDRRVDRVMEEQTSRVIRRCRVLLYCAGLAMVPVHATEPSETDSERVRLDAALLQRDVAILELEAAGRSAEAVVVFLGQDVTNPLSIVSVALTVDGREVLTRAYTDKESDAMRRGGMDRLTLGGINSGQHQLRAEVEGRDPEGGLVRHRGRINFRQDDRPTVIQILSVGTDPVKLRATQME